MPPLDFDSLWQRVVAQFSLPESLVHGPDHWRRVDRNARLLARSNGGDLTVVRLFALFHDSRREDDGADPAHGARGAALAEEMHSAGLFVVTDPQLQLLQFACIWHTEGDDHPDPTIGACWDADRLDLERIGVRPSPRFMSTELARQIAGQGSVERRLRILAAEQQQIFAAE